MLKRLEGKETPLALLFVTLRIIVEMMELRGSANLRVPLKS